MARPFYTRATVQVAIIGGIAVVCVALINVFFKQNGCADSCEPQAGSVELELLVVRLYEAGKTWETGIPNPLMWTSELAGTLTNEGGKDFADRFSLVLQPRSGGPTDDGPVLDLRIENKGTKESHIHGVRVKSLFSHSFWEAGGVHLEPIIEAQPIRVPLFGENISSLSENIGPREFARILIKLTPTEFIPGKYYPRWQTLLLYLLHDDGEEIPLGQFGIVYPPGRNSISWHDLQDWKEQNPDLASTFYEEWTSAEEHTLEQLGDD